LIATTTPGGKAGRPPASGPFLQAGEALLEEALAPLADDLPWRVETGRDLVIAEALGRVKDNFGTDDIAIL
jgi:hypothetical protein